MLFLKISNKKGLIYIDLSATLLKIAKAESEKAMKIRAYFIDL